jgi:predicted acyl esterase
MDRRKFLAAAIAASFAATPRFAAAADRSLSDETGVSSTSQRARKLRQDIEFKAEDGVTLRGWHYLPEEPRGKLPTIVMAHCFTAVKEMYLDRFAEAFAAVGLASVVFDNRNFGASDGEPRQEIDPWRQVRDGSMQSCGVHYAANAATSSPFVGRKRG